MSSGISLLSPVSRFISARRADLHYLEWGSPAAPPLVLLHGGLAHAHWWDHIAVILARDYRVVALDLRGHGDSNWSTPPAYEIEDYVTDLQEVCAALGIAPFVLLGHSLGGFIASAYAAAHAETLRALIVVDVGFRLGGNRFMRLLRHIPPMVYRDEADLLSRFRLLPADTRAAPSLLHHIAGHSVRPQAGGNLHLKCDRATLTRGPRTLASLLPNITCPALFLRGRDSQNLSAATLAELATRCPRARGLEVPDAGHHVFLDNPAAFLAAVRGFLSEEREDRTCET